MRLVLKGGVSGRKNVNISENQTVSDLKNLIADEAGTDPNNFRLVFGSDLLNNQDQLKSYNITDGSIIRILLVSGSNYFKDTKSKEEKPPIVIPSSVQYSDIFNERLKNPKVRIGIDLIKKGLIQCRNSGMEQYRNLNISNPLYDYFDFTTYNGPPPEPIVVDYEKKYQEQLSNLLELGFEKDICLKALINSQGDLDAALEWIEENQN